MNGHAEAKIPRRKFFQITAVSGALLAVGAAPGRQEDQEAREQMARGVIFRNPAFRKVTRNDQTYLCTQDKEDALVSYRLDESAAWLWDQIGSVTDFGKRRARPFDAIVAEAKQHFKPKGPEDLERDALAFLKEAADNALVVSEKAPKVFVSYYTELPVY